MHHYFFLGWGEQQNWGILSLEQCSEALDCVKNQWVLLGSLPLPDPSFSSSSFQGESTRLGSLIEIGFLLFPQGDTVNYDEIKRFIRQEIIKMFDGNWLGDRGCEMALPALTPPPRSGLCFLKLSSSSVDAHHPQTCTHIFPVSCSLLRDCVPACAPEPPLEPGRQTRKLLPLMPVHSEQQRGW